MSDYTKFITTDGTIYNKSMPYTDLNGVKHPVTIYNIWSDAELAAIGLKPFVDNGYDSTWYNSTGYTDTEDAGVITRTYTTEPKYTLEELKNILKENVNNELKGNLSSTDEYITRYNDPTSKELIPDSIQEERENYRDIAEIKKSTIDDLLEYNPYPNYDLTMTLDQAKKKKIREIDNKSVVLLESGFTYSSKIFDIVNDEERWKELLLAATAGLVSYPINVYAKDKTSISLADITEVTAFIGAFMATREGILQPGRVLKEQVAACTTKTEVDAIIDNR